MQFFGGDPGVPVLQNGKETFPLVPVAVGLYSTAFNLFNTALLFPFTRVFERVLSRIGHSAAEDVEDYSTPRFLDATKGGEFATGVPLVQKETARYVEAANLFLATARKEKLAPADAEEHHAAIDILSRDVRRYTAAMLKPGMPHAQADLLASLIEEQDFAASLGETLFQVARRIERQEFSAMGRELTNSILEQLADALRTVIPAGTAGGAANSEARKQFLLSARERCLKAGPELPWEERGAILALLGSAERAFFLIDRIDTERKSVLRVVPAAHETGAPGFSGGGLAPVPGR
jgi:phosphate:Na+ symporter